jgi:CubicO group peptidase (beta-lactamase class C family)
MGTLRRAWRGGLLLIGALFAAFALLALGIAMQAATRDIRYRWYAQQASATVIDKVIHHAGDPSTPRSQYLVRYRFIARDGSTQYGIGTLPFDTWDALRPGARLTVAYLPARAYGSRPVGDFGDGEAVGWGLIGVILGGVGLALLVVPLRRAWRIERLLREGIETEGAVAPAGAAVRAACEQKPPPQRPHSAAKLPDLSGDWEGGEGRVTFDVLRSTGHVEAFFAAGSGVCPFGDARGSFLSGDYDGQTLRGKMKRCTHARRIIRDYDQEPVFATDFYTTSITEHDIEDCYRTEYWKAQKPYPLPGECNLVRDPSGDRWNEFHLSKTSLHCPDMEAVDYAQQVGGRAQGIISMAARVTSDPAARRILSRAQGLLDAGVNGLKVAATVGHECGEIRKATSELRRFIDAVQEVDQARCGQRLAQAFDHLFEAAGDLGRQIPDLPEVSTPFKILAEDRSFFQDVSHALNPEQRWNDQFSGHVRAPAPSTPVAGVGRAYGMSGKLCGRTRRPLTGGNCMRLRHLHSAGALILWLTLPLAASAYPAPPPDPTLPKSDVPVAVQQLRRDMLDADVSTLTFHSMDQLFTTRTVGRSGPIWEIPRADHALDFSYEYQGQRYTPEQFLDRTYTNALLVIKNGRIVYENYRNNTRPGTRFIGWSMTKSITSILVGCALHEGRIHSLDDPITQYLPELKGGGYDGVSIRHILQMRSGVDYLERYDFGNPGTAARNHERSLVENVTRFADVARTIPRAHPPGEVWQYKTLDTAVLGWLLERVSGGSTVAAYTAQRLWEPLGAESDGFYIMDGPPGVGREFSGAGFNATLRDFARIGLMMLNGGVANGHRIVSAEWVRESTQPAGGPGPGYGYQWWTFPASHAYQALGLQGQHIYVDPDTQTVIVKLSYVPPDGMDAEESESASFFAAASAWRPD